MTKIKNKYVKTQEKKHMRACCCLGDASLHLSVPASICLCVVGMTQIQGMIPLVGQHRLINFDRQSMASPRW